MVNSPDSKAPSPTTVVASTTNADTTKQPEFALRVTQVKKKVSEERVRRIADREVYRGVYATGTLVAHHDAGSYAVAFDDDDTETWTVDGVRRGVTLAACVGIRVAQDFDGAVFAGHVVNHADADGDDPALYGVLFDDDDYADLEYDEVMEGKALFERWRQDEEKNKKAKRTRQAANPPSENDEEDKATEESVGRGKRRRKAVRYCEDDDDDDDDDMNVESDDEPPIGKKKGGKKTTAKKEAKSSRRKSTKKKSDDDDDDEFDLDEVAAEVDDDSLGSDVAAVDSDDDVMEVELERDAKPKAKARSPKAKTPKKSAVKKAARGTSTHDEEFHAKLAKDLEGFKPINNPQKWPENGDFVDPVGVDPTHGIVEGIVAKQVSKVGKLLQMVVEQNRSTGQEEPGSLGELTYPIKLQTACSGTDAPSIALELIKESLDKICGSAASATDGSGHPFSYSHEMSCEIEPFKQGYLGRNFPGVPLFPDITKLTASDQVLDVYGRPQSLPDGNLFIAGTSCKDFSMLKTRYRLDIEDKGTSGETFLAAVEFLEQKQPPVAIFENVDKAPWDKMQEYITGRLKLENRNETKNVKDASKKADADNLLKFSVDEEGRYVAEAVPRQVGIRAGCRVEGFVRAGDDSTNVLPLVSKRRNGDTVTLRELARDHGINLERDTLVMEKRARYCTHLCKLDTKEYGLPQTRNRKYLFMWRSDDPDDDLGEYFEQILDHLKTPLLHSMDAFLLPDTHDRIRCFREALRSGPGLMVRRERAREPDFWNWGESRVRDLTCHLAFREGNGIEERARWLTNWSTRGRKQVAPGLWPELADCWKMRMLDMVDCFGSTAIRDGISRDPMHHSFTWDLSQNVNRAPFRAATAGVSGCVTPGGELLLPHRGRTVTGVEKLLLQGIPCSRIVIGPESEVQLSDLAGNAFSLPVVSAAILAAICAPQLRRKLEGSKKNALSLADFALAQKYDAARGAVLAERGDLYNKASDEGALDFAAAFGNILKEFSRDAFRSSILCTCESSGTTTLDPTFLECSGCAMSICRPCSGLHQVSSHTLQGVCVLGENNERIDPHDFERKLRCLVPSVLRLASQESARILENGQGLEAYSFQLQNVVRKRGHWEMIYGAWEDYGRGRQVAEIRVRLGRTSPFGSDYGLVASVRCFAPAIRTDNPYRGQLKDSARLTMNIDEAHDKVDSVWETPQTPTTSTLTLVGSDEVDSQRVLAGITDKAAVALKDHSAKVRTSYIPPIKSRNPLTHYHKSWKTWPGTILVSGDPRVDGVYRKTTCQHTVVLSALWRRETKDDEMPMYLYIRPDVLRTKLDVAVFSPSPKWEDRQEICELHDWIPENALVEATHKTQASFLTWKPAPEFHVKAPEPTLSMLGHDMPFADCVGSQHNSASTLCRLGGLSNEVIGSLLELNDTGIAQADSKVSLDLFGKTGTRNAKRLSIIAAPTMLKYAAQNQLPLTLSEWYSLPSSIAFGKCEINIPPRPVAKWQPRPGRVGSFERVYDPEESNEYYARLFARPRAFEAHVDAVRGELEIKMNPFVIAHRAAAHLGGQDAPIQVKYCLTEISSMGEPPTREFVVPNSDAFDETHIDNMRLPLYKRQAKAVTRMKAIENRSVAFAEEEFSEAVLPGVGWCLRAKAAKTSPLRGGVLGDAIGSGKTVVTIALVLDGVKKARARRDVEKGISGATLIVVPPGLLYQWDEERKKFTGDALKCIVIDSTKSLQELSVTDLVTVDIVIAPVGIVEETKGSTRIYTQNLSKKSCSPNIPPAPKQYSVREAPSIEGTWVRNMAAGPETYVGNKGNQMARDAQAYYSHCYAAAIEKLREKKFAPTERGVPLEWFLWERVVIDECHETLITGKAQETTDKSFGATTRRGAREFLGVAQTDPRKRPLMASVGVWGLTGTPLLETEARVTELANLMGGTYLTGGSHHWRKEESESGRDLFLNSQSFFHSREYRCAIHNACHQYVRDACQRNRGETLHVQRKQNIVCVSMSQSEGAIFLKAMEDLQLNSFTVQPAQLGEKVGDTLALTASSKARQSALCETIDGILQAEPHTKIVVFANSSFGGYQSAKSALAASGKAFSHVSEASTVAEQNETISWFRHVDVTEEEKQRPRILLLSFEQAAGHNLQEACHNVILYEPYYSGSDAVADASVEEQSIGRVYRQGQKYDVTVTRIILQGPNGERCLDADISDRNSQDDVLQAAMSNFD